MSRLHILKAFRSLLSVSWHARSDTVSRPPRSFPVKDNLLSLIFWIMPRVVVVYFKLLGFKWHSCMVCRTAETLVCHVSIVWASYCISLFRSLKMSNTWSRNSKCLLIIYFAIQGWKGWHYKQILCQSLTKMTVNGDVPPHYPPLRKRLHTDCRHWLYTLVMRKNSQCLQRWQLEQLRWNVSYGPFQLLTHPASGRSYIFLEQLTYLSSCDWEFFFFTIAIAIDWATLRFVILIMANCFNFYFNFYFSSQ